jgi:hypothetical protein
MLPESDGRGQVLGGAGLAARARSRPTAAESPASGRSR